MLQVALNDIGAFSSANPLQAPDERPCPGRAMLEMESIWLPGGALELLKM
jgi:hypothetical protein